MIKKTAFKDADLWLKAAFSFLAIILCFFLGLYQLTPPSPVSKEAPEGKFSAERALTYLENIAKVPHPTGSQANETVREYIAAQIKQMGLEPVIQEVQAHTRRRGEITLQNVMTRLKGTENSGAVLVMAHYDSVPTAPGASDNGAAVAAALESLNTITKLRQFKNDLIFLFSDAEELGLWGARKFAELHPWMKDIAVVLNYEARGHMGPSLMFETNEENGWMIGILADAAPSPRAYSWAYEVYKRMPNNSDFTVFKRKGITGLNFAFIGGMKYYHSRQDNIENLERSSFQHHGENMLPLLIRLGNSENGNTKKGNRVYFSVFNTLVHYPAAATIPLLVIFGLLFLGKLFEGIKNKHMKMSRIIAGFFLLLLVLAVSALVMYLLWQAVSGVANPDYESQNLYTPYQAETETGKYMLAFSSITAALFCFGYFLFFKRIREEELFSGALLLFFIFALLTGIAAPGGSYLFVFPLVFGTLALGLKLKHPDQPWSEFSWKTMVAIWLTALPSALILVPNIDLLTAAMGLEMFFALGNLFLVLMLGLLIFHLRVIMEKLKWYFPAALLAIGLFLLVY